MQLKNYVRNRVAEKSGRMGGNKSSKCRSKATKLKATEVWSPNINTTKLAHYYIVVALLTHYCYLF